MQPTLSSPQTPASLTPARKILNVAASVAACSALVGLASTGKELAVARGRHAFIDMLKSGN